MLALFLSILLIFFSILESLLENPSNYPKSKKLELTSPISDEEKPEKVGFTIIFVLS